MMATASPIRRMPDDMRNMLERMLEGLAEFPEPAEFDPAALRNRPNSFFDFVNRAPCQLDRVEDITWSGPFGETKARLYFPHNPGEEPLPLLVFFHGGGWIGGSIDMEESSVRALARQAGCCIASVDYVLAPEHKFPDPVNDCVAAVEYLAAHGHAYGIDTSRIAVGGSSAGANLAAAAVTLLGSTRIEFVLLQYGVFDTAMDSPSYWEFGNGDVGLTAEMMQSFLDFYVRGHDDVSDPRIHIVSADLRGWPPAFLSVAGLDPLRDDSRKLADRLREANVPVEIREYAGAVHGFSLMVSDVEMARQAINDAAAALRSALLHSPASDSG